MGKGASPYPEKLGGVKGKSEKGVTHYRLEKRVGLSFTRAKRGAFDVIKVPFYRKGSIRSKALRERQKIQLGGEHQEFRRRRWLYFLGKALQTKRKLASQSGGSKCLLLKEEGNSSLPLVRKGTAKSGEKDVVRPLIRKRG